MSYRSPDALLPLTPVAFEILLALADEPLHGYAILQAVEARLSGLLPLRTGTLYRSLARLLEDELIEEAAARDSTDERRRCYRITTHGRKVAALEAARLEGQVVAARARRLLPSRKLRP
ncbi:MAG TPA: PadR family transcriptional regulator [Vicinamibacterales bacterium]|jgi:DNA-binding PadR family transcriptional regulator|nr:helix-turn-helix transcriptional regulator [Acidobacteriota bacterium]HQX82043.1 PadR family transcriptional regulator [Vicinamibacterales bacterium]